MLFSSRKKLYKELETIGFDGVYKRFRRNTFRREDLRVIYQWLSEQKKISDATISEPPQKKSKVPQDSQPSEIPRNPIPQIWIQNLMICLVIFCFTYAVIIG